MLKTSFAKSQMLINNRTAQPVSGLIQIAAIEPDTLREMFGSLCQEDHGNLAGRQQRMWYFMSQANAILEKYYSGKWKFKQDFHTVMGYISLLYPDRDYMFKSTQAKDFINYTGYPDSFGAGVTFSLSKYYTMCNAFVAAMQEAPELLAVHQTRWVNGYEFAYRDHALHVLAYDVIYCASVYNLFEGISRRRKEKM